MTTPPQRPQRPEPEYYTPPGGGAVVILAISALLFGLMLVASLAVAP